MKGLVFVAPRGSELMQGSPVLMGTAVVVLAYSLFEKRSRPTTTSW
jgi:hypothetical protein